MTADPRPTSSPRRRRLPAGDLALVSTFAALIAALGVPGLIAIPGNPVPITLQTLGVMLAGALLGARRGTLAVLTFMALVAAGLPLLAGGRGGLGVFVAPPAGYLIGWIPAAAVIGLLAVWLPVRSTLLRLGVANVVGGMLVVYAVGIPVFALIAGTNLSSAAALALTFVPGDALKVVLATTIGAAVHRAVPDVLPVTRRERERAAA